MPECAVERPMQALIFDLDGTLVDTVYPHVVAWQQALEEAGMTIDGWRIHRRIGMSGGLFMRAVSREVGRPRPARGCAASGCGGAGTDRTSCSRPVPTASTATRPSSRRAWTSSASYRDAARSSLHGARRLKVLLTPRRT